MESGYVQPRIGVISMVSLVPYNAFLLEAILLEAFLLEALAIEAC
jgi:hypothetical protein